MSTVKRRDKDVYVYDEKGQLIGYGGVSLSSPLSNYHQSEFIYSGHKFQCSEVAIMWAKADTFGDQTTADKLLTVSKPNVAKLLGRSIKPFNPKVWLQARNEKVPEILYQKFTQIPELKQWLLSTGTAVLAEIGIENGKGGFKYHDPIWGIAIGPSHPAIKTPEKWKKYGKNFLGKTLMSVRQRIVDEMN